MKEHPFLAMKRREIQGLDDVLRDKGRILIAGVPRSGKTTLAKQMAAETGAPLFHTDDLIGSLNWSELSRHVAEDWMARPGPWIIEGVRVPHAVRKWFRDMKRADAPCDRMIWMPTPRLELSDRQRSLAKGCLKVFDEVVERALESGVGMEVRPH